VIDSELPSTLRNVAPDVARAEEGGGGGEAQIGVARRCVVPRFHTDRPRAGPEYYA